MEKKDTWEGKARVDDFTFATPAPVPTSSPVGLYRSTGLEQHSKEKELRRTPRKRKAKRSLDGDEASFVRHIHVSTTEDLVRQASQEAAHLENVALKQRQLKEMGKIKRPMGPFVFFLNEYRSRTVKDASLQKKKTNLVEMTKQASVLWKEMDDESKKPYQEMAAKDKQRYAMEKKQYSGTIQTVDASLPDQFGDTAEPVRISLRSYQQHLQDQIDDLQNRLNMFQSRCSQLVQPVPPIQPPHMAASARQGGQVLYMDHGVAQQIQCPTPVLYAPVDQQNQQQQQQQQQAEERGDRVILRGRIFP